MQFDCQTVQLELLACQRFIAWPRLYAQGWRTTQLSDSVGTFEGRIATPSPAAVLRYS
jgi:hypothetical protein